LRPMDTWTPLRTPNGTIKGIGYDFKDPIRLPFYIPCTVA
jgi:hypothetical protein